MKTKIISLLILLSLSATAQISILSSDMPVAGDTVRTSITSVIAGFDFEQTGANHIWDYQGLQPLSQRLDTFKTVSQTPVYFWPSFIISANLASRYTTAEILPDTLVNDAYSYFSNTTASFRDIGLGLMVMGLPIPLKFSTPDLVYSFPMTMNSTFSSNAYLEFSLADMGYISIQRDRQNEVDGWGTLKTPYGTFDVIRLKSVVYEVDSIYLDTLSQGLQIVRNYTEYKWLAKNLDVPLLHCTVDQLLGTTVVYRDSIRDLTVAVKEMTQNSEFSVFPNPTSKEIQFELCAQKQTVAKLVILNLKGEQIYEQSGFILQLGCRTYHLDLLKRGLSDGVYFVVIQYDNHISKAKFIYTK